MWYVVMREYDENGIPFETEEEADEMAERWTDRYGEPYVVVEKESVSSDELYAKELATMTESALDELL